MTAGTFRHPSDLAIAVATVDQMSNGRIILGIGTGWYEREHQAFGIPFPPIGERFDRLTRRCRSSTGCGTTPQGEPFSFDGRFWQLEECTQLRGARAEAPATDRDRRHRSAPHPAVAAKYADEFNSGGGAGTAERFANVRQVCEEIGRDPSTIHMSVTSRSSSARRAPRRSRGSSGWATPGRRMLSMGTVGDVPAVVGALQELKAAGAEVAYLHIFDIDDHDHLRLIGAEVLPQVA